MIKKIDFSLEKNEKIILILVLFFSLMFSRTDGQNDLSRIFLSQSLASGQGFIIDNYTESLIDRSYVNNHYYTDKPPMSSFLSVPFCMAYNSFSEESFYRPQVFEQESDFGIHPYFDPDLKMRLVDPVLVKILVFFLSGVPTALTIIFFYRICREKLKNKRKSLILALIFFFGTSVFIYSTMFFGNTLAMFFVFLSYYVLRDKKAEQGNYIISGLFLGIAFSTNYLSLVPLVSLLFYLLDRDKEKLFLFSFGIFIGLSPFFVYDFIITGNPFIPVGLFADPKIWQGEGIGIEFNFDLASIPHMFLRILFYPYRGLFFYSPVLLLFFPGLSLLKNKREKYFLLFTFVLLSLIITQLKTWWAGSTFNMRFFTVIIPFLFLPLINILKKKKYREPLFVLFLLSLFVNLMGLQIAEEVNLEGTVFATTYMERFDKFLPIENPLLTHYLHGLIFSEKSYIHWELIFPFNIPPALNFMIAFSIVFSVFFFILKQFRTLLKENIISIIIILFIFFSLKIFFENFYTFSKTNFFPTLTSHNAITHFPYNLGGTGDCVSKAESYGFVTDPCWCTDLSWVNISLDLVDSFNKIAFYSCAGNSGRDGTLGHIYLDGENLSEIFINENSCDWYLFEVEIEKGKHRLDFISGKFGKCNRESITWRKIWFLKT